MISIDIMYVKNVKMKDNIDKNNIKTHLEFLEIFCKEHYIINHKIIIYTQYCLTL